MRGKALFAYQDAGKRRITPAYAGKSLYQTSDDTQRQDHPRLCGEKEKNPALVIIDDGSPPPMRGKD